MEYKSHTNLTVRYSETDRMGIVHHSRYYPWFEIARGDFIKQIGISYSKMEKDGIYMPLTETGAKYIEGVCYDEEVIVTCKLTRLTVVRCTFEYEVIRVSDNKVVTLGTTSHAFCDTSMRPINLKKKYPDYYELIEKMVNNHGEEQE